MLIHRIKFVQCFLLIEVMFACITLLFIPALSSGEMPKAKGVNDQKSYLLYRFTVKQNVNFRFSIN